MTQIKRCYSELAKLKSIEDRYEYLKLFGTVGSTTFGWDRLFNQRFYHSSEWLHVRDIVMVRDNGCDLGIEGFEIHSKPIIHHMNPMRIDDLREHNLEILNPEYLILVSPMTHQAIHFGDSKLLPQVPIPRRKGDTRLW